MTDLGTQMDPRLLLATMLIGATASAITKVVALIRQNSGDDAELAALIAEADARIARRDAGNG